MDIHFHQIQSFLTELLGYCLSDTKKQEMVLLCLPLTDLITFCDCGTESDDADCPGALQATGTQQMWFRHAHHLHP